MNTFTKKRVVLAVCVAALVVTPVAQAINYTFGSATVVDPFGANSTWTEYRSSVIDLDGAPLAIGAGTALYGSFATLSLEAVRVSTYMEIAADFVAFASAEMGTTPLTPINGLVQEGMFYAQGDRVLPGVLEGKQAFILVTGEDGFGDINSFGLASFPDAFMSTGVGEFMSTTDAIIFGTELDNPGVIQEFEDLGLTESAGRIGWQLVAVPEPSSTLLMGMGIVCLSVRRRRKA